ncbi:MAG: hypothetical protein E7491_00380 [Ruminococcaceae bacterium]|nr:hypothetical protein [Oscillospiraceae bacterium]
MKKYTVLLILIAIFALFCACGNAVSDDVAPTPTEYIVALSTDTFISNTLSGDMTLMKEIAYKSYFLTGFGYPLTDFSVGEALACFYALENVYKGSVSVNDLCNFLNSNNFSVTEQFLRENTDGNFAEYESDTDSILIKKDDIRAISVMIQYDPAQIYKYITFRLIDNSTVEICFDKFIKVQTATTESYSGSYSPSTVTVFFSDDGWFLKSALNYGAHREHNS